MTASPGPRTVRVIWAATLAGAVLWLALIFLAPWLAARGAAGPARLVYAVFAPVCHQIPERCFSLAGRPVAVCGRCLGVYAGFLAGLLLYPLVRGFSRPTLPRAGTFIALTLPLAVDGLAGVLGLWRSPIGLRFATGIVWGAVLPFYFVTGLSDLVGSRRARLAAAALAKKAPGT